MIFPAAAIPEGAREAGWEIWRFSAWGPWLSLRLLHLVLFLLGAYLLDRILVAVLRRIRKAADDGDPTVQSELERRVETVTRILRRVGGAAIYITAVLMILNDFGVQIAPLLAGLGIVGVAVGFGAQTLVKDMITGFFIVLEDQFRVGDVIRINEFQGVVEYMGLRTTRLRALGGEVHILPNSEIRMVTNFTRQWARAVLDVEVSYRADLDAAFRALEEAGRRVQADPELGRSILEPFEVLGVTALGDSGITLRMTAKVEPLRQWAVERALRKAAKEVFDGAGIEIPFPQRTVSLEAQTLEVLRGKRKETT
jgi:small conductance mechanosensitive channel